MTKIPITPETPERMGTMINVIEAAVHRNLALASWAYASQYYVMKLSFYWREAKSNQGRGARILMAKLASLS